MPPLPRGTTKTLLKLMKPDWLTQEGVELAAVSRSLPARGSLSRTFCECSPVLKQSVPVWGQPSVLVWFSGVDVQGVDGGMLTITQDPSCPLCHLKGAPQFRKGR